MSQDVAGPEPQQRGWRPRPFGFLLIAAADFCGAVGLGNMFFGQSAAAWLLLAAALLLAGISAGD